MLGAAIHVRTLLQSWRSDEKPCLVQGGSSDLPRFIPLGQRPQCGVA